MRRLGVIFSFLVTLFWLTGCVTPDIYHVALKYEPTSPPIKVSTALSSRLIAVATFIDEREIDDTVKIGHVLRPGGKRFHVLPERMLPRESVAESVADFFRRLGCKVASTHPSWDLKETTIDSSWGDLLVGGTIEQLDVVCDDSSYVNPVKSYQARVRLTMTIADGKTKKILHRTQGEATSTLKDITFSEEKLAQQINTALSQVIEQLLADYLRTL